MAEAEVVLTFVPLTPEGPLDPGPVLIRHARLGLTWKVQDLVESWVHPYCFRVALGEPRERRRYRLVVHGPLPGRPGEQGAFTVAVRSYGDRHGWWMTPV